MRTNNHISKTNGAKEVMGARSFSKIAQKMYVTGPILTRKFQHWRPYICPFEKLVGYINDGSRVLDIGCGAGLLLSLATGMRKEFEGVGFDSSRRAIGVAKDMAARASALFPKARLSFERIGNYDGWPKETFDVVFLIDVLHHVHAASQHEFLLQAISRVKPGGLLVYKDMCIRPRWKAQANRLHDLVLAGEHITYLPIETAEQWALGGGLEVVVSEEFPRLWYGHELRVFKRSNAGY